MPKYLTRFEFLGQNSWLLVWLKYDSICLHIYTMVARWQPPCHRDKNERAASNKPSLQTNDPLQNGKNEVPAIRKNNCIGNRFSMAQNMVSCLDLGWHLSRKEHPWGHFFWRVVGFAFAGAALHKTAWVTVLIAFQIWTPTDKPPVPLL